MRFHSFPLALGVVAVFALSSCGIRLFDGDPPASSRYKSKIDKEYTFIVGILTPDSLRDYPQEVFVGKLVPNGQPPLPPFGSDSVVKRVIFVTRNDYRCAVVGSSDARVFIISPDNKRVELSNIGNGVYRDVNKQLSVQSLATYKLTVAQAGATYTAQTTVPGKFTITNLEGVDTLAVARSKHTILDYYGHYFLFQWSVAQYAQMYRMVHYSSPFPGIMVLDHTFEINDSGISVSAFDSSATTLPIANSAFTRISMEAIDSSYTAMYGPESSYSSSDAFKAYYRQQEKLSPDKRTNIKGPNPESLSGVFGSYSSVRYSFVAVPKPKALRKAR